LTEIPEFLKESKFPPSEHYNDWAEPFIGQLICFDLINRKGQLFCINGIPETFTP